MKHPSVLFLILFSAAFCLTPAQAQTNPNVCQAQLFFADINAQGDIILTGNTLHFIDRQQSGGWTFSQQPAWSSEAFSIDKSAILDTNEQSGTFSLYTRRLVRFRSRAEKYVTFRFNSGNCTAVQAWLRGVRQPSRTPGKRAATPPRPPLVIWAKHRRSMRPDASGELVISDRMITFGNRGASKYQWEFRFIRDISQDGAYVLRILPFVGGEYTFDLQDRGISAPEFRSLRARILR